jgi:nitrite reductase/ring-hydroxylating ferredoxin subunit
MAAVKAPGYTSVASVDEMPPGVMRKVNVDGKDVVLANVDGRYFAIGNVCTHEEGPLDEGILDHYEVECPWHNSRFDLRTGAVTQGPADSQEPSYEVRVEGNSILIRAK